MRYETPEQLASIRPIDILSQDMFDDMVTSIPTPVPAAWRAQFNRLNAIARRHDFAWPYQRKTRRKKAGARLQLPSDATQATGLDRGRSAGHIASYAGWEYFTQDGYLYRAEECYDLDPDGYRRNAELVARYGDAGEYLRQLRAGIARPSVALN
jgi:fermentation-respiration switch protein FrsA (DUF1100 family)